MKRLLLLAPLCLLAGSASAAQSLSDSYGILQTRSIFSRNAVPATEPATRLFVIGDQWPTPPTQRVPILRGVIEDKNGIVALLEVSIPGGNGIQYLHVGDLIAWNNSQVREITMEGMHLSNGKVIALGMDLQDKLIPFNATPGGRTPSATPPAIGIGVRRAMRGNPPGIPVN